VAGPVHLAAARQRAACRRRRLPGVGRPAVVRAGAGVADRPVARAGVQRSQVDPPHGGRRARRCRGGGGGVLRGAGSGRQDRPEPRRPRWPVAARRRAPRPPAARVAPGLGGPGRAGPGRRWRLVLRGVPGRTAGRPECVTARSGRVCGADTGCHPARAQAHPPAGRADRPPAAGPRRRRVGRPHAHPVPLVGALRMPRRPAASAALGGGPRLAAGRVGRRADRGDVGGCRHGRRVVGLGRGRRFRTPSAVAAHACRGQRRSRRSAGSRARSRSRRAGHESRSTAAETGPDDATDGWSRPGSTDRGAGRRRTATTSS
jgi:hypothetical protein